MKNVKRAGIALGTAASMYLVPALAFAEEAEATSGAEILIPKPGEVIPALVIFLIILAILGKLVWPKVMDALDTREKTIEESIQEAEETKEQSAQTRDEAEAILADARRKASEIVLEARGEGEKERARIVAAAHAEAEEIISKAHDRADDEVERAYANATDTIAKVSVAVASKIVGDTLENDEEKQHELIKKYLSEVGSLHV